MFNFKLERIISEFLCDVTIALTEDFTYANGRKLQRCSYLQINKIIKTDKEIYFNGTYLTGLGKEIELNIFPLSAEKLKEFLGINDKNISQVSEVFFSVQEKIMV